MKIALFALIAFLGLVVAGMFLAGPSLKEALGSLRSPPEGTAVRAEPATRGQLTQTVKAPGKIEPRTKVDISSEVSARIEDLPYREGASVRRGEVVVKLDDRDLAAALASAKARSEGEAFRLQAEQARLTGFLSALAFARRELDRRQALFDSGDMARRELDETLERVEDLQAQVDAAKHSISVIESSLAAAKADIDRAEQSLAKTVIRAPMDGIVTALNAEIGEVVLVGTMNNPGTVIMTIADLSRMILKAEVAETDIAKVEKDQAARVHINAYRDDVFSGRVTQVALQRTENQLDGTGYFEAEVEIDLRGQTIRSGHLANVDIEIATLDGVMVESQSVVDRLVDDLPEHVKTNNPLVDRAKKSVTVAYRVVDGKAVCTPVRRGASDDTHSIVEAGLNEGDLVVVGPYKALEQLKHDELIKIEGANAPVNSTPDPEGTQIAGNPEPRS